MSAASDGEAKRLKVRIAYVALAYAMHNVSEASSIGGRVRHPDILDQGQLRGPCQDLEEG